MRGVFGLRRTQNWMFGRSVSWLLLFVGLVALLRESLVLKILFVVSSSFLLFLTDCVWRVAIEIDRTILSSLSMINLSSVML
jgi:hypothetical protein